MIRGAINAPKQVRMSRIEQIGQSVAVTKVTETDQIRTICDELIDPRM